MRLLMRAVIAFDAHTGGNIYFPRTTADRKYYLVFYAESANRRRAGSSFIFSLNAVVLLIALYRHFFLCFINSECAARERKIKMNSRCRRTLKKARIYGNCKSERYSVIHTN